MNDSFLAGAGQMGALVRAVEWQRTRLGPLDAWPQSLRTAMSICLNSRFPIALYWGPEFLMLYNESLVPMVGAKKHPGALGQPASVVLSEIWTLIEPLLTRVRTTGQATLSEDLMLPLARNDVPEEGYFTFTYSPIRDESGDVGGVFCAAVETTDKVIEGRRLRLLNALAGASQARTPADACAQAAGEIARATSDVPFALLYLTDESGVAHLAGASNIEAGTALAPVTLRRDDGAPWSRGVVDGVAEPPSIPLADGPGGARGAVILPIEHAGGGRRYGFVVLGLAPLLSRSASYARFHNLLAASISQGVSAAAAHEEERQRADALVALDRAKTEFFSNVSHELRTPLTLMLGPAEDALANAASMPSDERERWLLVQRSALRLSRLVTTLLDFSRIEAGRVEASYEPTDLSALTGELASMFRSAIDRGGLQLRLELSPIAELAFVDREMWEKIVLNLLSNALKFTLEGEISVSLRLSGGDFELAVRDSGIGIAPDELTHVFDRFHRIKGVRARTHEGTGIGLALVAELAKLHGGHARVESELGKGTTFFVHIPRGNHHLPADRVGTKHALTRALVGAVPIVDEALRWTTPHTESQPPAEELPATTQARARVLYADDNADVRDYVSRLMREQWDVEAVADGEAALAAIRSNPPDLVLTDVMMPGLDGFGLLRAIRSDDALRFIPVILLSARAGLEATAEGLAAGANDYVVKPFVARDLLVRIASRLAVANAARDAHAIEESERRRLYGHFMQAPFPIGVLRGPRLVIELANPMALEAWGKDASIVGKPLVEGMPELKGQPYLQYLDEVFRTGVAYQARGALARLARAADDTLEDVYFDFVYAPLRDAAGTVDGILVAGFVVTAQVRAAQELQRLLASAEASERQFRELVENLPALAWTARADGFIEYFNRRWFEYTGTTLEETQGWGWKSVHDPAMIDAVTARWQHSVDTGEPFEMEFPLRGADGRFRWFLTRVTPIRDDEGRIIRWFGSNTDIDERRRNDDFRETFLGILGHDLRNPLSTILVTASALTKREDTPGDIRKKLQRVTSSGIRMERMIEQLLDLTRSRLAGGIPVTPSTEPLALAPLVGKIVDEVQTAHPASRIELRVEGDCRARVDADRFEQVVSNLVGNAVTHGDATKPIEVVLAARSATVSMVVLNHGRPIDPAWMPLLFNPFARGGKPQGRSAGLGLGLYISERIIDAHRGTLSVTSTLESGTRFEVMLPASGPAPLRVLVVDDDDAIASAIVDGLTAEGHLVATARDGREAMDHLRTTPADVIVLDLMMPGMNGYQFRTAQLRDPAIASIPVIVVSASPDLRTLGRLKIGTVLLKPFDLDDLLDRLRDAVVR